MQVTYTRGDFLDRVYRKGKSDASRESARIALGKFDKFCLNKFQRMGDEMIRKIAEKSEDVYKVIDLFVGYMDSEKMKPNSIRVNTSWVRRYLTYCDIDISNAKFKERVTLPTAIEEAESQTTREDIKRVLQVLPLYPLRLSCFLILTTLRRPNEVSRIRVRDINFDSKPATIRIPGSISKNRKEGITFTTCEVTQLLRDHIKSKRLGTDDLIFPSFKNSRKPTKIIDNGLQYHLSHKLPDLDRKKENSETHVITPYTFKDFGYTRIDKRWGRNFANQLKGDKHSPYSHYNIDEMRDMYLEVEPELTIFNADKIRHELDGKYADIRKELDETKRKQQELTLLLELAPQLIPQLKEALEKKKQLMINDGVNETAYNVL